MSGIVDPTVLAVAVALGCVTYALRLGGLLLGDRLPRKGRAAHVMERLPAIIVVSIVAVGFFDAGWRGWVAGALTVALSSVTRGLLIPMGGGVALIALLRLL
jgi:uncharacterized membrane protein